MTHREKEQLAAKIFHALYPKENYWLTEAYGENNALQKRYFAAIDDLIKQGVIVDG
jgi:hypothetical protein